MRHQPIDAWEVEAARRREVIESDFGATSRSRRATSQPDTAESTARRLVSWIAAFGGGHPMPSGHRAEPAATCQHGLGATTPGT